MIMLIYEVDTNKYPERLLTYTIPVDSYQEAEKVILEEIIEPRLYNTIYTPKDIKLISVIQIKNTQAYLLDKNYSELVDNMEALSNNGKDVFVLKPEAGILKRYKVIGYTAEWKALLKNGLETYVCDKPMENIFTDLDIALNHLKYHYTKLLDSMHEDGIVSKFRLEIS